MEQAVQGAAQMAHGDRLLERMAPDGAMLRREASMIIGDLSLFASLWLVMRCCFTCWAADRGAATTAADGNAWRPQHAFENKQCEVYVHECPSG